MEIGTNFLFTNKKFKETWGELVYEFKGKNGATRFLVGIKVDNSEKNIMTVIKPKHIKNITDRHGFYY